MVVAAIRNADDTQARLGPTGIVVSATEVASIESLAVAVAASGTGPGAAFAGAGTGATNSIGAAVTAEIDASTGLTSATGIVVNADNTASLSSVVVADCSNT